MPPTFNRFQRGEVDPTKAVSFRLDDFPNKDGTIPEFHLTNATEANTAFWNAALRVSAGNKSRLRAAEAGKLTKRHMDEARDEDRRLYAKHVVVGWSNMQDDAGEKVAFSEENVLTALFALPDWIFDMMRNLARNPALFADLPEDVAGAAKNSPSA